MTGIGTSSGPVSIGALRTPAPEPESVIMGNLG
jgi:hypothetical protein